MSCIKKKTTSQYTASLTHSNLIKRKFQKNILERKHTASVVLPWKYVKPQPTIIMTISFFQSLIMCIILQSSQHYY